jgi:hypothetical protein
VDLHLIGGGLDTGDVLRLQATAGNQAVGQLLAERAGPAGHRLLSVQAQAVDCPPAPAPLVPVTPEDDPRFQAVTGRIDHESAKLKAHPPASAKVAEAERGAEAPSNDVRSQAARDQVDQMSRQKPKGFDKAAFIAAVHGAIDRATPKTMQEVDDFTSSGKPGQLREQVVGQVGQSKDAAGKDIKDTTRAAPDPSKGVPKPVTPMTPEAPGPHPAGVGTAEATPLPLPPEQVSLQHGRCETANQLSEAEVTQEQVDESNEPQFQDAMASKKEADEHADAAPAQFREEEQATLAGARGEAGSSAATSLAEAHHSRAGSLGHVGTHKGDAKSRNEAELARVAREIEAIYGKTKADVEQALGDLDGKVGKAFDEGEKAARDAFEGYYKTKKDEYFDDRYSGFWGWKRWLSDKAFGPPAKVNGFIVEAKNLYVSRMNQVIDGVATIVETELNRATARIEQGRQQIQDYVAQQPRNLRKVAQEEGRKVAGRFEDLSRAVTDKSSSLVEGLAQKYVAAAKQVEERCEAMREENKGLIDKVKDKIAGMIEAIKQMKELLSQIADKAAAVAGQIIRHPIRFLENLVGAVKQGFDQFTDHIETHMKEGVLTWLFGEVARAGIVSLPSSFDLKSIFTLITQLLGFSWDAIRARAVNILGAAKVALIEKGEAGAEKAAEIFTTIRNEGLGGVAHLMADKVGEVKEQALDFVKGMVISEVVMAGVKWVVSLFNPVGAFIKACKAIYDIVMFFVNHAREIAEVVNTILDSLGAIVAGNISAAAKLVEDSLAKAIPLVIGFLASLLGLGDFGAKIRGVMDKVREPVNLAIDWVLTKVVNPMVGFAGRGAEWAMGKAKAGAAWVKGKAQQGVVWTGDKLRTITGRKTPPELQAKHQEIARAASSRLKSGGGRTEEELRRRAPIVEQEFSPQVSPRAALRIVFQSASKEGDRMVLPFDVLVIPNTTVVPDKATVTAAGREVRRIQVKLDSLPDRQPGEPVTAYATIRIPGYPGQSEIRRVAGREEGVREPAIDMLLPGHRILQAWEPGAAPEQRAPAPPRDPPSIWPRQYWKWPGGWPAGWPMPQDPLSYRNPQFAAVEWRRQRNVWLQAHASDGEHPGSREHDAERKLLLEIATNLRQMPKDKPLEGFIVFGANKEVCAACRAIADGFARQLPGIHVFQI